jgi:uncharacterized protein YecA (UPF0149 family)
MFIISLSFTHLSLRTALKKENKVKRKKEKKKKKREKDCPKTLIGPSRKKYSALCLQDGG